MSNKNIRVIVEIDGDTQFSCFSHEGKTGGVSPLDPELLNIVKAQLQDALLQVEDLLSHK